MSGKSIVIKLLAGVLAIGILLGCIYFLSRPEEIEKSESIAVFSADETLVTRVESDEFVLRKNDDIWEMEGMEGIAVNSVFASTLVKSLCNITSPMLVEENAENLAQYGLEDGAINIGLSFGEEEKVITIGDASGEYYYLKADANDVYIVSSQDLYMVFLDKIKYLDNTAVKVDTDSVISLSLGDVRIEKQGDNWYETSPYEHPADNDKVEELILGKIGEIKADDIVKKSEAKLKGGKTVTINLADDTSVIFKVYPEGYICYDKSNYAYKVADTAFAYVEGFDLLNRYVAPVSIREVSEVELISPKGTTVLSIEAPDSEAPVFYKNGEEATDESFRMFYQTLMGLAYSKEGKATGKAEYEIKFTKTDGGVMDIKFISANEAEFAISINGETDFLINKKSITDVFECIKNIETL